LVKDGLITRNEIQYIFCCLLCLKKHPSKFLDSLVAIYSGTTNTIHKHIASTHPNFHLAHKHQSLEPKHLISILTFAFVNANNIHAFIESSKDCIIKCIHAFITWLVVNHKVPLLLATDVDLNEVTQATSYLKPGSYVLMMPNKIYYALISMFSKFTMCVNALIVKARTMYMLIDYNELVDKYTGSNCG
jgi:hypothetical protein